MCGCTMAVNAAIDGRESVGDRARALLLGACRPPEAKDHPSDSRLLGRFRCRVLIGQASDHIRVPEQIAQLLAEPNHAEVRAVCTRRWTRRSVFNLPRGTWIAQPWLTRRRQSKDKSAHSPMRMPVWRSRRKALLAINGQAAEVVNSIG
jgi:hypothetical protein